MRIYLNGSWIDSAGATVSVEDRGFLFADGIYEVLRFYGGRLFLADPHLKRMQRGLEAIRIDPATARDLLDIGERLIDENGFRADDGIIYAQITRGAAPRRHAFPDPGTPATLYVTAKAHPQPPPASFADGVAAITLPDTRWGRCDIKSIALLPNVLANQAAHEAGAFEAVFVRDGVLIEGSHSNLMGVVDGVLVTYPECNYILGGITRRFVLDVARELDIPVREGPLFADRIDRIQELFLTGTTTEVMPITRLDDRTIGGGRPGAVARRLQQAYREAASARAPALARTGMDSPRRPR
jgi:D-alanine transaminase